MYSSIQGLVRLLLSFYFSLFRMHIESGRGLTPSWLTLITGSTPSFLLSLVRSVLCSSHLLSVSHHGISISPSPRKIKIQLQNTIKPMKTSKNQQDVLVAEQKHNLVTINQLNKSKNAIKRQNADISVKCIRGTGVLVLF